MIINHGCLTAAVVFLTLISVFITAVFRFSSWFHDHADPPFKLLLLRNESSWQSMTARPRIVLDDPWLEPHEDAVRRRMERFYLELDRIEADVGGLLEHASIHQYAGVTYDSASAVWCVREWAPMARSLSLVGDFNGWDRQSHPLTPIDGGIWEIQLPATALAHGQLVKLHVIGADGSARDRIPATIRRAVQDSVSHDFIGQIWAPALPYRWQHGFDVSKLGAPRIYEAHVGMSGEEPRVHDYREFADQVLPRIAAAGYNGVQLMAVQEHPYYGSFGYHVSSFFAPSSRFGTPEDVKYLVDSAHALGIAVLLDIVHSHSVKNLSEGLNDFDGSGHQYFHDGDRGEHPQWDSKCFDYGKVEVRRFLLSNVRYWLEEFRFDGFRFDGVTSMLYHSRGDRSFGSYEDYFGSDSDEDAVLYLQLASHLARTIRPGCLLIAEDMSGMPGMCRPIDEGGLGFTHRLAMGIPDYWIKLLKHQRDEDWNIDNLWSALSNRRYGEPTIAYAESHDQALVGDKTLAFWLMDQEMYWHMAKEDQHPVVDRGVALHKMIRLITLALGGEGWLNFMGNEFGHPEWLDFPREGNGWSFHYCRRQWSLVDDPNLKYTWLADFDRAMMRVAAQTNFLATPPARLLEIHHEAKILVAERAGLLWVFNFSVSQSRFGHPIPIVGPPNWKLALDTDSPEFGGHARLDPSIHCHSDSDGKVRIYSPCRSAQVYQPC